MAQTTSTYNKTKTIQSRFDYAVAMQSVLALGKDLYGPGFRILEEDRSVILKLLCWFLKDDALAEHEDLDLERGLLLTGPVGCGKTAIMHIMRKLCDPSRGFLLRSCSQVSLEFAQEGYDVVYRYTHRSFCIYSKQPRTICFDDLGFEENVPYFGAMCNPMAQVLAIRYDLFVNQGMITHATTNLNSSEMERRYGNRIRSRMRQMFNLITFPHTGKDKRG
jgi:energy-coupling factor transporter ATP-binding protein EcfA2